MAADPPPPYEAAPVYEQTPPHGTVTLASQAQILEEILESFDANPPQNPPTTKKRSYFKTRHWCNYSVSFMVFAIYLMVIIGCSDSGLKNLYLVRFDNSFGRMLVKDDTYADSAVPLKREVTSTVAEPWPTRSTVSSSEISSASDAFATVTGISESGNWVASTPSATLTGSATRSSFSSVTASWYTGYTTLATSVRAATTTSYYTVPEASYLPASLSSNASYMGFFGIFEDAHYRHNGPMGIPDEYYVGIWSYGYVKKRYKTKRNTFHSGIDYSKMVNSNSKVWVYLPDLNYKEDEFSERSNLSRINNIAKSLQPLSVLLMVVLSLYVGMSLHILPRKWTPYLAPVSVVCSFVFSVLYSVVAKQYALYISYAFAVHDITVKKGWGGLALVWIAFGFQCFFCLIELTLYDGDI